MAKLHLSLACRDYDRTRPLLDGTLQPEGIEIYGLALHPAEAFRRMIRDQEFDVSELSFSAYTLLHARDESPFIAIPIFPYRIFRHSFIFINTDAGIREPQDLKGRRVGVAEYQLTAAIWIRGLLQHEYDVAPTEMNWFYGAQDEVRPPTVRADIPKGIRAEAIPPGKTLSGMLEAGEIDALMAPNMPNVFLRGSPKVQRLFPNFQEVEAAYFKKTGIFPIMHTVVIKKSLYEAHPWVATSLYKAFLEAKRLAYRSLPPADPPYTLVWLLDEVERARKVMGEDYWPYGFDANRPTLEVFTQYMWEQGMSVRKVEPQELFAPNTLHPVV